MINRDHLQTNEGKLKWCRVERGRAEGIVHADINMFVENLT